MSDVLSDLFATPDEDVRKKIVEELLSTENLDRKTDLNKPVTWACLTILQEMLERKKLSESGSIIANFTEWAFRYLVSKNRLSRKEYVEALRAFVKPSENLPGMNVRPLA